MTAQISIPSAATAAQQRHTATPAAPAEQVVRKSSFWRIRGEISRRSAWLLTGVFLAGYAAARFTVEFWRMPDAQFLALHPQGHVISLGAIGLTMGQALSLPMLAAGLVIVIRSVRRGRV